MDHFRRHPIGERLLASMLAVTMVASGVPTTALASQGDDTSAAGQATLAAAATQPSEVQLQRDGSEVYSGTSVKPGDVLSAVASSSDDDDDGWGWDYDFAAQADDADDYTYQWYRGNGTGETGYTDNWFLNTQGYAAIDGATASTYTVDQNDVGSYLAVKVSAPDGSWGVWSNSTGKVVSADAVELGKVTVSGDAKIGSTLTATAQAGTSAYDLSDLPADAKVSYTWYESDSKPSSFGAKSGTVIANPSDDQSQLTLTDALQGKYVWVVANAGINNVESDALGPVVAEGQTYLDGVQLVNAPSGAFELGTTLTAQAYTGSAWTTINPVAENVTYTWRYADSKPSYYGASPTWTTIEGANGATFTPTDESLVGKYLSVTANAGVNTVELSNSEVVGPLESANAEQEKVQTAVDRFTYERVTAFNGGGAIDHDAVTGDLQMPRTRRAGLDIDASKYPVTYSSDNNSVISFDGYHGKVVRPLEQDATVNVTLTITKKDDPSVTASKTLPFTVKALLNEREIDDEVSLLDKTEAAYKDALLDGQSEPAAQNLSTFQKAYLDADGNVAFARSTDEASAQAGIVPTELDGYDDMGSSSQARLFKSSNTNVVLNEVLQLAWNRTDGQYHAQPQYNTKVTVSSKLKSERFGNYYDQYKDNASLSQETRDKLKRLAGDDVSAEINIAGTSGQDDPTSGDEPTPVENPVHTNVAVIVENDDGTTTSWLTGATTAETEAGSTAADATKAVLRANGITFDDGLYTFTNSDGQSLGYDQATGKFWNLYVNGESSDKLASNVTVAEGDTYTWIYKAWGNQPKVNNVEVHPEKVRPVDTTAEWPAFRDGAGNVSNAPTPTSSAGATWAQQLYERQGSDDMNGVSEPILVGGKVFVAVSDKLEMLDPGTGDVENTATLAASIDSTCRMVYASGIIVVPLHNGMLQAITPDDLTTVWVTPAVTTDSSANQQSLSTLTVADGYVYVGTTNGDKTAGALRRMSLADGQVDWSYSPQGSAYYWSGAAVTKQGILIAQNSGEVDLMSFEGDNGSGKVIASVKLPSQVSSSVVLSDDGTSAYVMGYDGILYKVTIDDGALSVAQSKKFALYSVSTPTAADGKVYVGGSTADSNRMGALYVLDANTLDVLQTVSATADGVEIEGTVSSSPLVVNREDGTYVYFTANNSTGGVYVYKLGDDTCGKLYVPSDGFAQYTLSSVVPDSSGSLYYVNDSGTLFKLTASVPVYRLYNQWSGEHLFTLSASERDALASLGWNDEGVAWQAPTTSGTPVYRLYNPYSGDHHYTTSKDEYDSLVELGWNGEGVAFYSADDSGQPVYRLYNRWLQRGTHFFTTSSSEYDLLGEVGWSLEKIAFYALK